MKLIQISIHFEYTGFVERLLDQHGIRDYLRFPMIEGKDLEGKHFGTQVFPGNFTAFQAQVDDEKVDALLDDLLRFRRQRPSHRHLQALVLPVERRLEDEEE